MLYRSLLGIGHKMHLAETLLQNIHSPAISCSTVQLLKKGISMAFMFKNLEVYQKAVDLAEQIISLTEQFSKGFYFLTDQLNRASLSISLNIAEGNGRFTKNDRKHFFIIARASTQE